MKQLLSLTIIAMLFSTVLITACGGESEEEKGLKESDLVKNPTKPEDIATAFYYYICQTDYDKANALHVSEVHQFDGDKAHPCDVKDAKAEMEEEKGFVTFKDPVNSKKVKVHLTMKDGKWLVNGYSSETDME